MEREGITQVINLGCSQDFLLSRVVFFYKIVLHECELLVILSEERFHVSHDSRRIIFTIKKVLRFRLGSTSRD